MADTWDMRMRLSIGLIAGAAMLGSHWLAYVLAAPDGHARAHLLQVTGHGYWPVAMALGIAGVVAGLLGFVGQRLSADPDVSSSRAGIFRLAFPRALALQVGGFLALELLERVIVGHAVGLSTMLESTFVIGIAAQLAAALLAALLLVGVAYVVERLVVRPAVLKESSTLAAPLVSLIAAPRLLPATGGLTLRGPPTKQ